ncbi:hypothetical protein [Nostoc sp.]|uniref:hypothetical protein n=1 Tax=Nostoc sp. TaxID=1180 RepID=UPI002FF85AD9
MTRTVQELVEQLQGYPGNAVITIKDVAEQPFFIVGFHLIGNFLNIAINSKEEADDPGSGE